MNRELDAPFGAEWHDLELVTSMLEKPDASSAGRADRGTGFADMLARYRIVRGARAPDDPLPDGVRQDTRKHTRHVLRPSAELVLLLLQDSSAQVFARFKRGYLDLLEQRFAKERERFDELAALAGRTDVYLGCNCPTGRQRDVQRCHTVLALDFMRVHYRGLLVRFPER